jgi:hypothetical protein
MPNATIRFAVLTENGTRDLNPGQPVTAEFIGTEYNRLFRRMEYLFSLTIDGESWGTMRGSNLQFVEGAA